MLKHGLHEFGGNIILDNTQEKAINFYYNMTQMKLAVKLLSVLLALHIISLNFCFLSNQ